MESYRLRHMPRGRRINYLEAEKKRNKTKEEIASDFEELKPVSIKVPIPLKELNVHFVRRVTSLIQSQRRVKSVQQECFNHRLVWQMYHVIRVLPLVVLDLEKLMLVLQQQIEYVLKMFVLVQMV